MPATPPLLLLPNPFEQCPVCGSSLRAESATLVIHGPGSLRETIEIEHCTGCGRRYTQFGDLITILAEGGWTPKEATGFELSDRPVAIEVMRGPDGATTRWATFIEEIGAPPDQEVPEPEEAAALPERAVAWELDARPTAWFNDEQGRPAVGYATVVVDDDGRVRGHAMTDHAPADDEVVDVLLRAAVRPAAGEPFRPAQVHASERLVTKAARDRLAAAGLALSVAPTPAADEALASLQREMSGGPPPFLHDYDEAEVRRFFEAARAFYRKQPWRFIEGTSHVAYRLNDDPWRYLNVMGQMGQEPGLSVYDDWLHLCRFLSNSEGGGGTDDEAVSAALTASGAAEAVTLNSLTSLHPRDGAYVMELGLKPVSSDLYPMAYRIEADGVTAPRLPLPAYRALLQALADVVAPNRKTPFDSLDRVVDVDGTTVELRYPAQGDENRPDRTGTYRLVLEGTDTGGALRQGQEVTIEVPGSAPFLAVVYELINASDEDLTITALGRGDYFLWQLDPVTAETCPFLYQLDGLDDLWVNIDGDVYELKLMPRVGGTGDGVHVSFSD